MPYVPKEVLALGAPLFPLQPNSKRPRAGSHGYKDAQVRAADDGWRSPDENYAIVMGHGLLCVDFDVQLTRYGEPWDLLPATWTVSTRRGRHMLYSTPHGWSAPKANIRFYAPDGSKAGEVKGASWEYILGPGSERDGTTYELVSTLGPTAAPQWLLDYCTKQQPNQTLSGAVSAGTSQLVVPAESAAARGSDCIQDGAGRDDFLAGLAGYGRRWGLSERGLQRLLKGAIITGTVEQGDDPKTVADVRRIARSAARYEPEPTGVQVRLDGISCAADIELVGPPTEWWIRGFIPHNELVMLYGAGGIGKSSFASFVACEVTKNARFMFAGVEEPFARFAWRVALGGGNLDNLFSLDAASRLVLPGGVKLLEEVIAGTGIDFIYLDSVYTHFSSKEGQNTAERARQCLGPLAEMAQARKVTVLANFHENKAGDYLGSTEMINVARVVLHASRAKGRPLIVAADTAGGGKTNLVEPDYRLAFGGAVVPMADPKTGEVQCERMEDGSLMPQEILIAQRLEDIPVQSIEAGDLEDEVDTDY